MEIRGAYLTPVPWPAARKCWPMVRKGLETTLRKTHSRYWPEDVYADLRQRVSFLYLIRDKGFIVLQQRQDVDGLCLHVFSLYCPGGMEWEAEIFAELDKLARDCGAVRITGAGRKGWGRVGFVEASRHFEREV